MSCGQCGSGSRPEGALGALLSIVKTRSSSFVLRDREDLGTFFGVWYRNPYSMLDIRNTDVVLDAGANIGIFSVWASLRAKMVVAVEPNDNNYRQLKANIELNHTNNVRCFRSALSDFNGLGFVSDNNTSSFLRPSGQPTKVKTLDHFMRENGISNFDLMKIDVEGEEARILGGARALETTREIVVEVHGNEIKKRVEDILSNAGYRISCIRSFRLIANQILNIRNLPSYFLNNAKHEMFDFKTNIDFLIAKLGVRGRSAAVDNKLEIIYAIKRGFSPRKDRKR
jgi:FkbM family methyltransferase